MIDLCVLCVSVVPSTVPLSASLTKPQIRKLTEVEVIQLGLFDQVNLMEFESEDYPDERLIACRNPLIAQKNQQPLS
ncbi:hypothetical protein [Microcystis sp. BLCC-F210]|uniref:hypothetical protein n=1 Tax=Microcystis sp. BLCC-F210 TaxID=3342751 RepID=UPI0035C92FA2